MTDETWNSPDVRCLGVRLNGDAIDEVDERGERIVGDTLLLLLNAERRPVPFVLPGDGADERWETLLDTADPWPPPRWLRAGERYEPARPVDGRADAAASARRGRDRWRRSEPIWGPIRVRASDRDSVSNGSMAKRRRRPSTASRSLPAGRHRPSLDPALQRRVVSSGRAEVDGGRFPIKRTTGDGRRQRGHLRRRPRHRRRGAALSAAPASAAWHEVAMAPLGNDRWQGALPRRGVGRYEYTVEGWIDRFGTWRQELSKKAARGQDVSSELLEGRRSSAAVRGRTRRAADGLVARRRRRDARGQSRPEAERVDGRARRGAGETRCRGTRIATPRHALRPRPARSSSSASARGSARGTRCSRARPAADPTRSATFDEAAARCPTSPAMGFDVLYLPPIHPIGRSFRKGRNNTLERRARTTRAARGRSAPTEGGHTAVEPGLGTLEDFDRFVATARAHGLEIALDIAFQASPDHPVGAASTRSGSATGPTARSSTPRTRRRSTRTSTRSTSSPSDWQALWHELSGVIEFWIDHGVTIFRVDNPHTKPFALLGVGSSARSGASIPETIFLSEAFTRPKVMRYLAKAGFSQSYTYFTWRNTKAELTEYFSGTSRSRGTPRCRLAPARSRPARSRCRCRSSRRASRRGRAAPRTPAGRRAAGTRAGCRACWRRGSAAGTRGRRSAVSSVKYSVSSCLRVAPGEVGVRLREAATWRGGA